MHPRERPNTLAARWGGFLARESSSVTGGRGTWGVGVPLGLWPTLTPSFWVKPHCRHVFPRPRPSRGFAGPGCGREPWGRARRVCLAMVSQSGRCKKCPHGGGTWPGEPGVAGTSEGAFHGTLDTGMCGETAAVVRGLMAGWRFSLRPLDRQRQQAFHAAVVDELLGRLDSSRETGRGGVNGREAAIRSRCGSQGSSDSDGSDGSRRS